MQFAVIGTTSYYYEVLGSAFDLENLTIVKYPACTLRGLCLGLSISPNMPCTSSNAMQWGISGELLQKTLSYEPLHIAMSNVELAVLSQSDSPTWSIKHEFLGIPGHIHTHTLSGFLQHP